MSTREDGSIHASSSYYYSSISNPIRHHIEQEFIGGTLFTLLYDGVKHAMSKSSTFKTLLGDLKSTLDSLVPRDIQQIGEHNVELGLPNEEIQSLELQMEEGIKLVRKLSTFRVWNYCCLSDYTDQIVELDRALRRLLERLKMQEARDVKEVLVLARRNRDKLDEVNGRLLEIQKLLQERAGGVMENLAASGSNTEETVPVQIQGNGVDVEVEQGTSLDGGTSLEAVFSVLFDVVIDLKDKTAMFKPHLGDLQNTLDSLKPLIEEIAKQNKVLDRPKEELKDFIILMEKGVELIRKCSKHHLWASCKHYKYTDKLLGLDESLHRLLNILKVQLARDAKETFVSIKNIETAIKQIERSGVVQEQIQTKCWGALPEPLSLTIGSDILSAQGTRDVKETLVSNRNTKGVIEQIEASGMAQNQSEIKGTSENDRRYRDSNTSSSTGSQILKTSKLRVTVPRNSRPQAMLGEGGLGQVFKGWVDGKTFASSKVGLGPILKLTLPPPDEVLISKFLTQSGAYLLVNREGVRIVSHREVEVPPPIQPSDDQMILADLYVVKVIGKGYGGVVQLVQHKWTGQFFALKVVEMNVGESIRKQIAQELKINQSSQCPNIVVCYQAFFDNGTISVILEYMDGGSLADLLKKVKTIPEPYLAAICKQVVRGLLYLHHEKYIIHRDFKPSNLLINHRGEIKITDFGVSAIKASTSEKANTFVGTYNYMSPERIIGRDYNCKIDIWSLGIVLLECATGQFPYLPPDQGEVWDNFFELMSAIVEQPPPCAPSNQFSPEFCSFISACVQKDPEDRSSAQDLLTHPFINMYDGSNIDLSSYFSEAGSPLATI